MDENSILDDKTSEIMVDETDTLISNNNNNNNNNITIINGAGGGAGLIGIGGGVTSDSVGVLVVGTGGSQATPGTGRKEDEKITSAVMKVLQGYQWSLVPTTTK